MGKILSVISKPVRNFNVENRAHKVISTDKPVPAPKYKADLEQYERMLQEQPDAIKQLQSKHQALDKRLKDVFVISHDPNGKPKSTEQNPDRPLPLNRSMVEDFEYGFKQPNKVPPGRVTLKDAMKFINDYQTNSKLHTVEKISDEYLLSEETVLNIINHFKVFEVYVPQQRQVKASFIGPKVQRHSVELRKPKEIEPGLLPEEGKGEKQ